MIFVVSCQLDTTKRRTDFEVTGIDVSHHQGIIEWDKVADDQIHFAFIKATEGIDHIDTKFYYNWYGATTNNVTTGAYHFFRAASNPEKQAKHFFSIADIEEGDLPPVLDVETLDGVEQRELIRNMRTWLYLAEIHYGVQPIIYTNLKFYYQHLVGQFDDYPLWIARYNSKKPKLASMVNPIFWQYGQKGKVQGIKGNVDLNVYFGNLKSFNNIKIQPSKVYTYSYKRNLY